MYGVSHEMGATHILPVWRTFPGTHRTHTHTFPYWTHKIVINLRLNGTIYDLILLPHFGQDMCGTHFVGHTVHTYFTYIYTYIYFQIIR